MSTETNFNTAPFWDDYDPDKNYHRVLFRPGVPVQARELTQSQTIMQNQIERFGENIFKDGTIVKGCALSYDPGYYYIKLLDNQLDGQPVNPSMFANTVLVNAANVTATVVNFADGLESQNPNLNTLFVKYLNTGANGQRGFAPGEVISAYTQDHSVQTVAIANSGIGYSNSDGLVFTSTGGTGAAGRIVTDNTGRIQQALITSRGKDYNGNVVVSVANSSGGSSLGTGAILTADTVIAQLSIAGNTFSEGNSNTQFRTVGVGYALKVGEGTVFQKGFFVGVEPQTAIVAKYTSQPDGVVAGFRTTEAVVNNNVDVSLLDNAQGEPNYTAPGAFRLKLTPEVVVLPKATAAESNTFFTLVAFEEGRVVQTRGGSEYNVLGQEMARRTSEESGNYVVNPFTMYTDEISGNTTHIQIRTSSGLAYVNGYRVEQLDTSSLPLRKGTDVRDVDNVAISTNYANYILVNNLRGTFPFESAPLVSLYSAESTGSTTPAGTLLGTARIRSMAYDSGLPSEPLSQYRLYLFNVQLTSGARFADVKSVFYTGSTTPDNAAASLLLEGGKAVLKEPSFALSVFPLGRKAIKTIRGATNINDTSMVYSTTDVNVNFNTSGTLQKNLTGNDRFPYNGLLNDIQERDVIFVARNSANSSVASSGTVSVAAGNSAVTGTSTAFLTNYEVGDWVAFAGGQVQQITQIANNTSMALRGNVVSAVTGAAHVKHFPASYPIPFISRTNRTLTVSGNQQTLTAAMGHGLSNALNVNAVYNVQRATALQLTKNMVRSAVVKLQLDTNEGGLVGPWSLGVPDVQNITSVLLQTGGFSGTAIDVTSEFVLADGQMDTHYGLAYMRKKATSKLALPAGTYLTVAFDTFTYTNTGGGAGFFTVDSYPVNDSANAAVTSIKTQDIPVFTSPTTGASIDLRDSVDFRPVVVPTANVTTSVASATVNPTRVEAFSTDQKFFPAPNKTFQCDLQYYVGRYDKLIVASTGVISVVEGAATDVPYPPQDQDSTMTLATIAVAPYPTLSTKVGTAAKRPDYTVKVSTKQTRRYTMADLGKMDNRLQRIEYYTALSLLEKQTADLNIPSSVDGLDRFKNGIFVDPFADFSVGNVIDGEFTAGIDEAAGELIPRFEQGKFDLQIANTTGPVNSAGIVTLPFEHRPFITQPYANRVRNCVENYWSFKGKLAITPSYDNFYEVRSSPQNNMTINIDTASPTLALLDDLNSIRAINQPVTSTSTSTSTALVGTSSSANSTGTTSTESFETTSTTTTTQAHTILSGTTRESTEVVGDFLTDISFSPFMREQALCFRSYGMKPGATIYAYFDKVNVSSRCRPAVFNSARSPDGSDQSAWEPTGAVGAPLVVNAQGELFGIFYLPADTFFVGDRELKLLDVNTMVSESSASTSAGATFHGYNYSASSSNLAVSTRSLETDTSTSTSSSTTTTRSTENRSTFTANPLDPPVPPVVPPVIDVNNSFLTFYGPAGGVARQLDYYTDQPNLNFLVSSNGGGNRVSSVVATGTGQWQVYSGTNYTGSVAIVDAALNEYHIGSFKGLGTVGSARRLVVSGGGGGGGGGGGTDVTTGPETDLWSWLADRGVQMLDIDPVAQTFRVSAEAAAGQEGIFVSKLDLFFQRKDPNMGVTVELRLTENGYPSANVLPLGRKHLTSAEVNVSADASVATTVMFDAPVFLKSSQEYAFAVIPDANSPEYLIYTSVVGEADIQNPAIAARADWGAGVMFTSTNNSAWVSYQDEDIKFRLHRANFTASAGSVTLTNKNDEFLTGSAITGVGFVHGESVFKFGTPIAGTITFDVNSATITGTGTSFLSAFTPGGKIVLSSSDIPTVDSSYDVFEIASIASNTSLTLRGLPKFSAVDVKVFSALTAKVFLYEPDKLRLHLSDSTASGSNYLAAGDVLIGDINGATFTIESVDNQIISYLQPLIYRTSVVGTSIDASMEVIDPTYTYRGSNAIKFNDTNYLNRYEAVVASRSNEMRFMAGAKSFRLPVTLTTTSPVMSPTLDMQACSILRYKNLINNSLTNEYIGVGDAVSKYVSKTIVLADGQESEDIKVYATAYKPIGTSVDVYVRAMAPADSDFLRDKTWTKLEQQGSDVYSDSADRNSFREYEYTFPASPEVTTLSGTLTFTSGSATVTGVGSLFTTELAVGSIIKLINGANSRIVAVSSIASNTSMTVNANLPWTTSSGSVAKLVNPEEAFRNPDNLNALSYYSNGQLFDGYKTYAIKIVLRAESTNQVPRLRDVRAVALSV